MQGTGLRISVLMQTACKLSHFCFDANCLIVFIFMACYYRTRYLPGKNVQARYFIV